MKTKIYLLTIILFIMGIQYNANSQGVSINEDGTDPDASAILDLQSTDKGLLVPRMSLIEAFSISSPADGLIIYSTTDHNFWYWSSASGWEKIISGEDGDWIIDGNDMYSNNSGNIGIGYATALATHKLTIEDNASSNVLRLIGPNSFGSGSKINFGDAEYTYISEYMDDHLMVFGSGGLRLYSNSNINAVSNNGNLLFTAPNGGVGINDNGSPPEASAILDVKSTEKGILIPRMTEPQILEIADPANGLLVYNMDENRFYFFDSGANNWKELAIGTGVLYSQTFANCGDVLTDIRDGQVYTTIDINGQCWMAKNLNYGTQISTGSYQNNNGTVEKYCYNNSTSYCDNLGGLYQWNEMMNYISTPGGQGICPDGWHVPTDEEWLSMEVFLDPTVPNYNPNSWRGSTAGQKLKNSGSGTPFNWPSGNTGTNESGFTALPGGLRNTSGGSSSNPTFATFWTSTQYYHRELYYGYNSVYRSSTTSTQGMSVRCIKD